MFNKDKIARIQRLLEVASMLLEEAPIEAFTDISRTLHAALKILEDGIGSYASVVDVCENCLAEGSCQCESRF